MRTPWPTKIALATTLAVTAAADIVFAAFVARDRIDARRAGWFLLVLTLLFLARVAGQVVVRLAAPAWLPPTEEWNLMPYRFLLPLQLVFLAVMAWLVRAFLVESGVAADPLPSFGRFVLVVSGLYAGAMVVRYVVRMRRHPETRWFGGAIPIVFHWVLASFLFVFGSYHASY